MRDRLFRFLLRLYPVDFRDEYGDEMVRFFRDRCRREGTLKVSMEALPDLAITAWREYMDTLWKDLRYSIRTLRKSPGFTAAAVLTLALGIGANTAIFSVVNGVLLDPLPYKDPDKLVRLYEKRPEQGRLRQSVSAPDFLDWRRQQTAFESITAYVGASFTLSGEGSAELVRGTEVSPSYFHVLGVQPQIGRDFEPDEEAPGRDRVAILNHGLWQRRFGGDPKIVGRTILLNGRPFTVIGVLPDIRHGIRRSAEIWTPLVLTNETSRGNHYLDVVARLKPAVTLQRAQAEMDIVGTRVEQQYPNENTGHGISVFGLHEEVTGGVREALWMLLGAVGLVLLVACANVANLFLARTAQRRREISIRTALGAGAGRLIRQLLTESILLSLVGGVAGILLASWGVSALVASSTGDLPRLENVQVNRQVLFFTLAISVFTGMIFALAPALYAARTSLSNAINAGRGGTDSGRTRARGALVIAEVALALLLSIGAGLMMRGFSRLAAINPGFDARQLLAIDLSLQGAKYSRGQDRAAFVRDYLNRIRSLPGVVSAGATSALPFGGRDSGSSLQIEGRPLLPYAQLPNVRTRTVTPGYFETMRVPLRAGRLIANHDTEKAPLVALIGESTARQLWPDEDAVGKRFTLSGETVPREVVGIVGDVRHYALDRDVRPEMYFPHAQYARAYMTVAVRTAAPPEALAPAARRELAELDKDLPIAALRTVEEMLSDSVAQPRLTPRCWESSRPWLSCWQP
jgi:putative ABC transport system permease protein